MHGKWFPLLLYLGFLLEESRSSWQLLLLTSTERAALQTSAELSLHYIKALSLFCWLVVRPSLLYVYYLFSLSPNAIYIFFLPRLSASQITSASRLNSIHALSSLEKQIACGEEWCELGFYEETFDFIFPRPIERLWTLFSDFIHLMSRWDQCWRSAGYMFICPTFETWKTEVIKSQICLHYCCNLIYELLYILVLTPHSFSKAFCDIVIVNT